MPKKKCNRAYSSWQMEMKLNRDVISNLCLKLYNGSTELNNCMLKIIKCTFKLVNL